jgi:hypothetical protein
MSRIFEIEGFKVLWGTTVREEQFDISNFPIIPEGQSEPVHSIPELKPLVNQIIEWGKDFTPRNEINPVVASSWVSAFDPKSTGMNIHTDEDHGGTISAVVWFEGEEGCGGDLVLWDPRWENPKLWGGVKGDGKHVVPFQKGKIVMFPSSVWHEVTAYTGSTQRRSVNIVLTFRNAKQLALEEFCTDQLMEIGKQLGYNYNGSVASLPGLISLIKTKI